LTFFAVDPLQTSRPIIVLKMGKGLSSTKIRRPKALESFSAMAGASRIMAHKERSSSMSHTKLLSTTLLVACVFLATVAVAAPVSKDQPINASIQTSLQPDLTLKSTLATGLLTTASLHHKTCRCSCGYPCETDADCGGAVGSCEAFISCCDQGETKSSFQQTAGRSTRTGEEAAVVVNVKCK
jgi:hypothetical protein